MPTSIRSHAKSFSEGFTLIEIVVVLTIISILASIAIPNFRAAQAKAEAARLATQLHYVEDAMIEAIIDGATQSDLKSIEASGVSASVLGDYLTEANLEDVPAGFKLNISSRLDSSNPKSGVFVAYVMLQAPPNGDRILQELEGMFPPHSFGDSGGYFWVGIDSRTLARRVDGN